MHPDHSLNLIDRELRNAGAKWVAFALSRSADDWHAFTAAYRRAAMVNSSVGFSPHMPKPVLRVKAHAQRS